MTNKYQISNIKWRLLGGCVLAVLLFLFVVPLVHAQAINLGLEQTGKALGLPATDIRIIVANIIRIALGLLGIIFLGIVIYGGFLYTTAGGNEEQVEKAKSWLGRGIIGLAIILASFAIAQFVFSALLRATGVEGEGGIGGGGGGGPGGGGLPASAFVVRGITPSGAIPIRNVRVVASFNQIVDPATLAGNFAVTPARAPGSLVAGKAIVNGSRIEFVPDATCPPPNESERCFDGDANFDVFVGAGLKSASGILITCGGLAPGCEGHFKTGNLIDTTPPTVVIQAPGEGASVSENASVSIQALGRDDAGIASMAFTADDKPIGQSVPTGPTPREYLTPLPPDPQAVTWDTTGVPRGSHTLSARAFDINTHDTASSPRTVVVRAEHCFNGIKDGDEANLDCGGSDCGACPTERCNANQDCQGGVCRNNQCVEIPVIESVSPTDAAGVPNGKPGNYVTIRGQFFGAEKGTVAIGSVASPLAACGSAWGPNQIVIEVPDGAAHGPITVTAANNEHDATGDARGPLIPDFQVNNIARPGICAAEPARARPGEAFAVVGQSFGAVQGGSVLALGNRGTVPTSWSDARIASQVPVVGAGTYPVQVTVGGVGSNSVAFGVLSSQVGARPEILSFDPALAGPPGSLLTIFGKNFGSRVGVVRLQNDVHGSVVGETNLPGACSQGFWTENTITIRVPRELRPGTPLPLVPWRVTVERPDGAVSVPRSWSTDASALRPGFCALNPDNGPAGTQVTLGGERFGAASDRVIFNQNRAAAISSWADERITASVPASSASGPVVVQVGGVNSNGRQFLVQDCRDRGCVQGSHCCGNGVCAPDGQECLGGPQQGGYLWRFSTGVIPVAPRVVEECSAGPKPDLPSPSPWGIRAGGNRVCGNAIISARFTTLLDEVSLRSSLRFEKCTAMAEQNPCATVEPVPGDLTVLLAGAGSQTGFTFDPSNPFAASSTYRALITTGVRSAGGVPILRNEAACAGLGADCAYSFSFSTRNPVDVCRAGSVIVDPVSFLANHRGRIQKDERDVVWNANVTAREDQCTLLASRDFDWDWSASEPIRAQVTNQDLDPADGKVDPAQKGDANSESARDARGNLLPVLFRASIPSERVQGTSDVTVNFEDPRIIATWPSCDSACVNAALGARFNVPMKADPADPRSVTFSNNVALMASLCGNARLDPGENCDDGNEIAGDGCSSECLNEGTSAPQCGNGRRETGESCDGVPFPARCSAECLNQGTAGVVAGGTCGNGAIDVGEDCDGGGGCSASCLHQGTQASRPVSIQSLAFNQVSNDLEITPEGGRLSPNTTYKVIIQGDTESIDGVRLTGLNYGAAGERPHYAYSWTFQSRADEALCSVDHVDVAPATTTVRAIGAERAVHAEPIGTPDACSAAGQRLLASSYQWEWGSGNAQIATVTSEDAAPRCGNHIKEIGEDCDDGDTDNGDGCSGVCLWEGAGTYRVANPRGPRFPEVQVSSSCGDRRVGYGEECEDGNAVSGDGCNNQCLHEGSFAGSSTCGDGIISRGEDCDDGNTRSGDGCSHTCLHEGTLVDAPPRIDPLQTATARGVTPGEREGATSIRATVDPALINRTGAASFTVQCGFRSNAECVEVNGNPNLGVGTNSCCYPRPEVEEGSERPLRGSSDVCRNPFITFAMSTLMDSGSVSGNVVVDEATGSGKCREGTTQVGTPDGEILWCAGGVIGVTATNDITNAKGLPIKTRVSFAPRAPLEVNTYYRVRVVGDNPDTPGNEGVRSRDGVTMAGVAAWEFLTGSDICTFDAIGFDPPSIFFGSVNPPGNPRFLTAQSLSRHGGDLQQITPIPGSYNWAWGWDTGDDTVATADDIDNNMTRVTARQKNGETTAIGSATITEVAAVGEADREGREISGAAPVTVFLCENPWNAPPPHEPAPGSVGFRENATNFRIAYCRDRGKSNDIADDFPALGLVPVPAPPGRGIIREWLLPVQCGRLPGCRAGDAIGIRVIANPTHSSAEKWYQDKQFQGSPQSLQVNGYGAVRDGRTVYVNAANATDRGNFTNLYVISYNDGASADTQAIFNSLVSGMRFNANLLARNTNQCVIGESPIKVCEGDHAQSCRSDADCAGKGSCVTPTCSADLECPGASVCAAPISKLQRDVKRFEQAFKYDSALEAARSSKGKYPTLSAGSFVSGFSTSRWPSWVTTLGNEAGAALPTDPLNTFTNCPDGYDDETCWNADAKQFICPLRSEVTQYQSLERGERFIVSSELEFAAPATWSPPPPRPTRPDNQFKWENSCTNTPVSPGAGECGNGVRDDGEFCDAAEPRHYEACGAGAQEVKCRSNCTRAETPSGFENVGSCRIGRCGDGIINDGLGCDRAGANCARGHGPVAGTSELCDDGVLNGTYSHCTALCTSYGAHCGDALISGPEICDPTAAGYDGFGICRESGAKCRGDGECEGGRDICIGLELYGMAREASSCGSECTSRGPYCGDRVRNGSPMLEPCDSEVQTSPGYCSAGPSLLEACRVNANCGAGGTCRFTDDRTKQWRRVCASDCNEFLTWEEVAPGAVCGNGVVDQNVCVGGAKDARSCETAALRAECTYGGGICGEQCDDGNNDNTDNCIIARNAGGAVDRNVSCRRARCGDAFVRNGYESCDLGDLVSPRNGEVCTPTYGSTCNYCSVSCSQETLSGGACGDGAIQGPPRGPEICEDQGDTDIYVAQNVCLGGTNNGRGCSTPGERTACTDGGGTCGYPRGGCANDLSMPCEPGSQCRIGSRVYSCVAWGDLAFQGGQQCLGGCTAACPPAFASFALNFRTNPIPGFCTGNRVRSCATDAECQPPAAARDFGYCDSSRYRSQESSPSLASGDFVGVDIPACRIMNHTSLSVLPQGDAPEAINVIFVYDRQLTHIGPRAREPGVSSSLCPGGEPNCFKTDFTRGGGMIDELASRGVHMGLVTYLDTTDAPANPRCRLGECEGSTLKTTIDLLNLSDAEQNTMSSPGLGVNAALDLLCPRGRESEADCIAGRNVIVLVPSTYLFDGSRLAQGDNVYSQLGSRTNDALVRLSLARRLGIEVFSWGYESRNFQNCGPGCAIQAAYLPNTISRDAARGDISYSILSPNLFRGLTNDCEPTTSYSNNPSLVPDPAAGPDSWFTNHCPVNNYFMNRSDERNIAKFENAVSTPPGAIQNMELVVGVGGRSIEVPTLGGITQLLFPPGPPDFTCDPLRSQLVHLGVKFTGEGRVILTSPSVQACRP